MEIIDKIGNPVDIVNEFVASSFGKGWKGNYKAGLVDTWWTRGWRYGGREMDDLCFIGKKKFCMSTDEKEAPSHYLKIAGRLGTNLMTADGSVIAVFPDFKKQAVNYCQLYEDFFKRETTMIITDIHNLGDEDKNLFGFKKYSPSDRENELTKNEGLVRRLSESKAKGIEEAVKSLALDSKGTLTANGYQNEEEKREEYSRIIKTLSPETRNFLVEKLSENIPFLKISEKQNPQSVRKYFERFGAPIETIADLEYFYKSLLEIKE
ncbi:MAG: hypothetical protein PHQ66_01440 [Candidatus Nanoarchaeia archaeon]|nr:hypothetical protein [Candidatus Nanoarchaeia archaeon]MDD5357960.1 hypothetical protein [Candidatus Nanoarchaeia archaeon]MDD5588879.1 hypothetical protein [Candidatus Nanoarchaeia archaeon]